MGLDVTKASGWNSGETIMKKTFLAIPHKLQNVFNKKEVKNMKMKRWMAAGMAAMMTMSLVACGSSGEEKKEEDSAGKGGKKQISLSVWNGNWAEDLENFEKDFNSKNEDIELDVQMQTGDYADWLGAKVASNDLPDIYILTPYAQVQSFAEAGRIMDLSEEGFTEKVYEEALNAGKGTDGKIYAYPANYEYLGVFLRFCYTHLHCSYHYF